MPGRTEFITVARVLRPQGRRGEIAVELHTGFPEQFLSRRRLYALGENGSRRELQLESCWTHKGGMILKFRGMDSISDAEPLIGCEIQIPAHERVALSEGAEYISDLIGCRLMDVAQQNAAREIGTIENVQFGAGDAPLLVVKHGKREFLVPFAQEFLRRVDAAAKIIEMALPEGMLKIDAPLTKDEKRQQRPRRRD